MRFNLPQGTGWRMGAPLMLAFATGAIVTSRGGVAVAIISGIALTLMALSWATRWPRPVRYGLTVLLALACVLAIGAQVRAPSLTEEPETYEDVYTPYIGRGTGGGTGIGDAAINKVHTTGPGRLYVAFTCRGDGEVEVKIWLDPDVFVAEKCVRSETRERRQWIDIEETEVFDLAITASERVRFAYAVQFVEPGTALAVKD